VLKRNGNYTHVYNSLTVYAPEAVLFASPWVILTFIAYWKDSNQ
jgi:hypothetical protein